jgi:hypothetical protein
MLLSATNSIGLGRAVDFDESQNPQPRRKFPSLDHPAKILKRMSEGNAAVAGLNQGRAGGSRRYSSV